MRNYLLRKQKIKNKNFKKIVYIMTSMDIGGAENMLLKLCKVLKHYFDIEIIVLKEKGFLEKDYKKNDLKVHFVDFSRKKILNFFSILRVVKIVREFDPDLLQGWMYHGNFVAWVTSFFMKSEKLLIWNIRQTIYDTSNEKFLTSIIIKLSAYFSKKSYQIIYNSKLSSLQHNKLGYKKEDNFIIPNGFETDIFKPNKMLKRDFLKKYNIRKSNTKIIGHVARYHPMKDHVTFLKAIAEVIKAKPNILVVLVGMNINKSNKELSEQINRLKIQRNVILLDIVNDMLNLMPCFDVFVCSSAWGEGFPNSVGEAMSSGVPCVATNVGDLKYLIGQTGIIVNIKDHIQLGKGILKILNLKKSKYSELSHLARKRILDLFSIDRISKIYLDHYNKAISNQEDIVISDFANEWSRFNQIDVEKKEMEEIFYDYFNIFPKRHLNDHAEGIDLGCGSGRWAQFVSPKVKKLTALDASEKTLSVAKKLLKNQSNINFLKGDVVNLSIKDHSYDFAYSLGVLHHVKDIERALNEIYRILKPNAPFLIYLYYNFDNSLGFYKFIWKISDLFRRRISYFPARLKVFVCDLIAFFVYLPFAKISQLLKFFNISTTFMPLSYYKDKSFYTMRTDALDRFGTTYEKRYSRKEILNLLQNSGFNRVKFSNRKPYWCAISYKKS